MLKVVIPPIKELWDSQKEQFVSFDGATLELEHSLVSVSKWESKWNKSFLASKEMTYEETLYYIECMTLDENIDSDIYTKLTKENIDEIHDYIYAPMTATTVPENKKIGGRKEIVTSELIYYWMIESGIPFECQYWHLNRLLTLIKVCGFKRQDPKKASKSELMRQHAAINAANRARFNSRG